jgi:hypothetical protein
MTRLVSAGLVVVVVALAAATAAAGQDREPRFTIGGGAGVSDPFHGDFDFHAPGWEVAARGRPLAHLTVEAFASMWRHTTETSRTGLPLQGPNGVIGTVGELSQRTQDQTQTFGASLLPTFSAGRATFVAGGGANVMFLQHRFEQELRDCVGPAAITCGRFSNARTSSVLGTHVVAGIDVRVMPRVTAFGQYRILVPVRDPGSGHAAVLAGVRIAVG